MTALRKEIVEYVQTQIVRANARLTPYVKKENGWVYPSRYGFIKVTKLLDDFLNGEKDNRLVVIPGLRGVGKTTLLAQTYFKYRLLIKNIIYVSMDEAVVTLGSSITEVLSVYEKILGKSYEDQDEPVLLLIDEVQQDEKWAQTLKSLYDKSRNVFVICSGSSAVSLQSNPDIVRRASFEKLYPLSFGEYLMLKRNIFPNAGLKSKIKEAVYNSSNAKDVYLKLKLLEPQILQAWSKIDQLDVDDFLTTGTLPFTLAKKDKADIYRKIDFLLDRIITQDIQSLGKFDPDTLGCIKKLLFILAEGDAVSMAKLTTVLGKNKATLSLVLDTLEKAELVIKVPPNGSNVAQVRKPSKYLFMTPAVRMALLNVTGSETTFLTNKGKLLEDIVALHFYREFVTSKKGMLTYDSAQASADFILKTNNRVIAIEVGTGDKSSKQLKATMAKTKCDFGVTFSSDVLTLCEPENSVKVPLQYFLLM